MQHQCEKWRKLVQADMHYQHVLLGKMLAAWKVRENAFFFVETCLCVLKFFSEKLSSQRPWQLRKSHLSLLFLQSYQNNIHCILYQVAEKEEQRTRLLLR